MWEIWYDIFVIMLCSPQETRMMSTYHILLLLVVRFWVEAEVQTINDLPNRAAKKLQKAPANNLMCTRFYTEKG